MSDEIKVVRGEVVPEPKEQEEQEWFIPVYHGAFLTIGMPYRTAYVWLIHARPVTDKTGVSDIVISSPSKANTQRLAGEILQMFDVVWNGWVKNPKTIMRRVEQNRLRKEGKT